MTDGEALLRAIIGNPDEDTPRLVFADWLDENGSPEQAEVIRGRIAIRNQEVATPRLLLQQRVLDLCERHTEDWVEHCGLPLTWPQTLGIFRMRLRETIAWCMRSESLRTPFLQPKKGNWRYYEAMLTFRPSERQLLVNALAIARAELLHEAGSASEDPVGGRLLVFFPDGTLSDGAAEEESDGFFDADNFPAWDSWVCATEADGYPGDPRGYNSCLVSWVPPAWVSRVERGISVNPEECIRWASDVDTALTRRLREAGLMV